MNHRFVAIAVIALASWLALAPQARAWIRGRY